MRRSPEHPSASLSLMLATTARRVVLPALVTLTALLALPNAAGAALNWGSCVDFSEVRCANLSVPLDRAGSTRARSTCASAAPATSGPTMMYLSGGPGGAGLSEMLSVVSSLPELERRFRLIGYDQRGTGRSGLLRCPELEKDPHLRSTRRARSARRGSASPASTTRPRTPSRTWRRSGPSSASRRSRSSGSPTAPSSRSNTRARTRSTSSG